MKYKSWLIYIAIGILLGGVLYKTGLFSYFFQVHPVRASISADKVLSAVLVSHTKWNTLQGNAQFTWFDPDGNSENYNDKFVVSQPAYAFIDITNLSKPGSNEGMWICDGKNIYNLNKGIKTYSSQSFTLNPKDIASLPTDLSQIQPDTVYMHPMALRVGAPIMEYLYSSWFAQKNSGDTFVLTGTDNILNRNVWIIDHQSVNGDSETAWIDQATGVILQFHQIMGGKVFLDMKMNDIQVDNPVNSSIFVLPSGYRLANP